MRIDQALEDSVTFYEADLQHAETLNDLPSDIDVAFYLVHSMGKSGDFEATEKRVAENFVRSIEKTNCQQVIYLSGIVNDDHLSKHLRSRKQVEDILFAGQVPITVLRAGIIIGSGELPSRLFAIW